MQNEKLKCWYNNTYIKLKDVPLSVFDFGFIHSDATYDVFKVKNGVLQYYKEHYNRFVESCKYFGFVPINSVDQISLKLLKINKLDDAFVWICVWRGAPLSGNPRDFSGDQKSLVYVKPYYPLVNKKSLSLYIDTKHTRTPTSCVDQRYKNFNWIEFTLAQRNVKNKNFDTCLLLSIKNYITEGPGFGICFVKNGEIMTPVDNCLRSVTIDIVEKICHKLNIKFKRCNIKKEDIFSCSEAFACSTSGGITFISDIDQKIFKEHTLAKKLKEIYDRY